MTNTKQLQDFYKEDDHARRMFDWMAARERDISETSIDRICQHLKIERTEAISLAKKLAEFGCAEFLNGRRGSKTRLIWDYSCIELGQIAQGRKNTTSIKKPENPVPDIEDALDLSELRLTIAQAKSVLAQSLDIDEKNIEIIIKG